MKSMPLFTDLTFDIRALVDGKEFNLQVTVPDQVKNINQPQADAIIRVLRPNAASIEIVHVVCLY
jgi:hypothetical protein